jgi:hypothetical protein
MPLDYRWQRKYIDLNNYIDYDFGQYSGNLDKQVRDAFGAANIKVPILNESLLVLDTVLTDGSLRDFYLSHPPNPSYPYFVFASCYQAKEDGTPDWMVLGTSSHGVSPGRIADDKYTFIWTQSIRNAGDNRIFAQVLIHELGHVRAGLTHPLDPTYRQFGYHVDETDEEFSSCVMHQLADLPRSDQDPKQPDIEQILDALAFCGVRRNANETHCVHFLKQTNY